LDKKKINIDDYFKDSLKGFEGKADDGLFDAIKDKVDHTKVPVDDYFKKGISGFEPDADPLLFDAIKNKVDASKTSIDSYFRDALLDYNSNAGGIPFIEIQNKLDRERVIDEHFKNALQDYQGKVHEEEFAAIRRRVLEIQERRSRKRYAWLLLLLLIPGWMGLQKYLNPDNGQGVAPVVVQEQKQEAVNNTGSNSGRIENGTGTNGSTETLTIPGISGTNNSGSNSGTSNLTNTPATDRPGNVSPALENGRITPSDKPEPGEQKNVVSNDKTPNTPEVKPEPPVPVVPADNVSTNERAVAPSPVKPTNPTVRKKKSILKGVTLDAFVAPALNNRYLSAGPASSQYVVTRNAADQQTTKLNFGINASQRVGRFSLGFGLHQYQFGQSGTYNITRHLYDSILVITLPNRDSLYLRWNERDSLYQVRFNNSFTTFELPLQFAYTVCEKGNWTFQTGGAVTLSYVSFAKGSVPNANSTEVNDIRNIMNMVNRFGSAAMVDMKFSYKVTPHLKLNTDLYLKTNLTSLYQKNTGIVELPYSFGWRWGAGYIFKR
jgi:hypothetical protein